MTKRIDIKNVPEELYEALVRAGESRRETVPATVLRLCSDSVWHPSSVRPTSDPRPSSVRPQTERVKFVAPQREEYEAYYREAGGVMNPRAGWDWYQSNGWKQGNGNGIKDWKAAARGWVGREREKQGKQMKAGQAEVEQMKQGLAAQRRNAGGV